MRENEILDLYWSRNEAAIQVTADTYGAYCYTIAHNILGTIEDAEECVNDTWLKAWFSIPPNRPSNLSGYLGKLTRNLALNRHKLLTASKRGMGQTELALSELEGCIPAQTDIAQTMDEIVLTNAIDTFLRAQPQADRNIFIGRYWYLYSIRELAQAYRMSESKITSLLYRMRKKLKLQLEKEGIIL